MQPIQLGDGDSAYGNMTEFINKTVIWDDIFNHEVTSNMCGSLRRSEPQPGLMDTQQSESQLDFLRNFVHDDKNWDEMTSNNQEWEGMYCPFQGGFSSETNSNTAFGLSVRRINLNCLLGKFQSRYLCISFITLSA